MSSRPKFKVCGLSRLEDARAAAQAGAVFLGFIFHERSPRHLSLEDFARLRPDLPDLPKVAVSVTPSADELAEFVRLGFDFFQIHFPGNDIDSARAWSSQVGKERLWLAPKIAPGTDFDPRLLELADTILWDGYKADQFGGTGRCSDWEQFRSLRLRHPETRWILAGGLSSDNAREALAATQAEYLDFNSGVESSPGKKDQTRLEQVSTVLGSL